MKNIKYLRPEEKAMPMTVNESQSIYVSTFNPDIFSIKKFNQLSDILPFSLAEWASILHISDRTLQRYIKEDKPFDGLQAEHLYQIEKLASLGVKLFGSSVSFEKWLRTPKPVLGKTLDFNTLTSFWGTKLLEEELGRVAYGVYI